MAGCIQIGGLIVAQPSEDDEIVCGEKSELCKNCASLRTEVSTSRTMFRIKQLEGGKFELEREGGSS